MSDEDCWDCWLSSSTTLTEWNIKAGETRQRESINIRDLPGPKCPQCGMPFATVTFGPVFCPYCGYGLEKHNKWGKQQMEKNMAHTTHQTQQESIINKFKKWLKR